MTAPDQQPVEPQQTPAHEQPKPEPAWTPPPPDPDLMGEIRTGYTKPDLTK